MNDPKRFDIIVFHAAQGKDYIKRIIGLPGEHVMINNNQLYIDGEKVEQPFMEDVLKDETIVIRDDFRLERLPGNYEVIPEDYYLVQIGRASCRERVGYTKVSGWVV